MKKCLMAFLTALALLVITSCGAPRAFTPDYESAVGAIFVNADQALPENERLYAAFEDNSYAFDLDAAWVYFFYASEDVAYAGDMNFTSMTFGAELDEGTVGASGTVAYLPREGARNAVAAYYLYRDETGVYFNTGAAFAIAEITDGCTVTGTEYACVATFRFSQPAASFTVTYDRNDESVSQAYAPDEVVDYQAFDIAPDVTAVTVVSYDADGRVIASEIVSPENPRAVICFDIGGQILANRLLRFIWQD